MQSKFIETNHIKIHYLEHQGNQPTIILMHGLTANANCFDGLVNAGLSPKFNVLAIDLRGRGLSNKPEKGYTMAEHAKDIIGILDSLNIEKAVIGGHSFGAFVTYFLAHHYPERVDKIILIDAAIRMHPRVRELLIPALSRIGQTYPSFEYYIEEKAKKAPFLRGQWDDTMLSYYRADMEDLDTGEVKTRSSIETITQCTEAVLGEPWLEYIKGVSHQAILINATGAYGKDTDPPLLPKEFALETVEMMQNCIYKEVLGNHQTMLYGKGAKETVNAIVEFIHQ